MRRGLNATLVKVRFEYLGHIISQEGVATDPNKIATMQRWPTLVSIKGLRGFLGLTGYYRRFVKGYGTISKPLTELLKKNNFHWTGAAQEAFDKLKRLMTEALVLAMPDYSKPFVVEVDACDQGIGAVLTQEGKPLAYLSKAISKKNYGLFTYEKEFLAILMAVSHWQHYLGMRQFVIKADHESLKHLMEQRIHIDVQQKSMLKLMGLDYVVQYKRGRENKVADALSRRGIEESSSQAISAAVPAWVIEVTNSYQGDEECQKLIAQLTVQPGTQGAYTYA